MSKTYVVVTEYTNYGILWVGQDPDAAIRAAKEFIARRPYDVVLILEWDKTYRRHVWTVTRTGVTLA